MTSKDEKLIHSFESFFVTKDGRFQLPGNIGKGRTIVPVCREICDRDEPLMYETLVGWDDAKLVDNRGNPTNVLDVCRKLMSIGQWEGAWAVAQLYYDQLLKQEAKLKVRLHKGHPACGLAILGREIGSPTLCRHYAMLSSAGDVYWEDTEPDLRNGGFGVTMLEQYGSVNEHDAWRDRVRQRLQGFGKKPVYLEALLAADWFGESLARHILDVAAIKGAGKPFAEVLLDPPEGDKTGTCFEAAAGLLLASTPGFEVRSCRKTTDEQIDLVVWYSRDRLACLPLPEGPGLVECKSSRKPVGVDELRDFGAKCLFHRVGFGILIARTGITGAAGQRYADPRHAELVRRRFESDGLTLLVLDGEDMRGKARELRGLQDALLADHESLIFGPKAGE